MDDPYGRIGDEVIFRYPINSEQAGRSKSRPRTFLSLLGWFLILSALLDMDDPYGRIGDELISRYPIKLNLLFIETSRFNLILLKLYGLICYTLKENTTRSTFK